MTALRETAKAKLNLTLAVLGRRADGYHGIASLVAFTELGDEVEFEPEGDFELAVAGPFVSALTGPNLIMAAAEAAMTMAPGIRIGHFRLTKLLPVAAGLGGGSADAAASLRLLARANPGTLDERALSEIALRLGSDVTACLASLPAFMTGRGENVTPVAGLPSCGVVLANPRVPLETESVYAALHAAPVPASTPGETEEPPDFGGSFDRLIDYAGARTNDLELPALSLMPAIGEVLDALCRMPGARLVRLSGSGPTCFALFASEYEAKRGAAALQATHLHWWVAASRLSPRGEEGEA